MSAGPEVAVYEVGLTHGKPYYTMKVVRGRTLSDVIKKLKRGDKSTLKEYSLAREDSTPTECDWIVVTTEE